MRYFTDEEKSLYLVGLEDFKSALKPTADNLCPKGGWHEYTPYTGLRETFEYCKKCDERKK